MRTTNVYLESKMAGKKGKRMTKGDTLKKVVPPTVLIASLFNETIPDVMTQLKAGKSSKSKAPKTGTPGILGKPTSPRDEFSEPESSLFDYQQMDEAGYSTVGFGTWPANKRQQKKDSRPDFRPSGLYSTPGDLEFLGQGDSSQIGNVSDLYATPMKKNKGKGKRKSTPVVYDTDSMSMSRTQQDVQTELKKIYNMPPEPNDFMTKDVRTNSPQMYPGSTPADSGRGSSRPLSVEEGEGGRSPELISITDQVTRSSKKAVQGSTVMESHPQDKVDAKKPILLDNSVVEELIVASQKGGQSLQSRTPRGSEMEVLELKAHNDELLSEIHSLRDVAEAIRDGSVDGAKELYVQRQLKDENETLKSTVHRLNVALSEMEAKYRPVDSAQVKQAIEVHGLPPQGPVPSWLISTKYLAPLFLAYDDQLEAKDQVLIECKKELATLKKKTEEILKENERLRISGGPGDRSEWQQLQEQARSVLEENQVLMEQLEVQANKSRVIHNAHMAEISRMSRKVSLSEAEKADTERQLEELRVRFRELKHKHDQMTLELGSQVDVHTHINTIADLKRCLTEEQEKCQQEMEAVNIKLKASEEERKRQAMHIIELTAENKRLKIEMKAMQKSVKQAQQKMAVLHQAIELSDDKEKITQEQLANVIKVAEKVALERDTVYKVAREQQEENKQTVNKMMHGTLTVGKMEEKLKLYRLKASAKLNTIAERLKEQDEAFNHQKKEYEREIHYLRLLVKEKEEIIESLEKDKKFVEKDLESMWQAANSENKRVKEILLCGPRKLCDHIHLTDALKDEIEKEELLHFSDDDSA
ncbi:centrosomal protein of 89 kDa isoform X1 [Biomphalaria pfeifferi]|uniref:Centrosomal protein of 89 kDa isoform X1 n=1 Tax=Biomphalaria pfeifferi TaxID=112525 RepID=A0AAD8AYE7_BIOPF|nr:centrosomal protein of 89 kDa isoform X1 [Biomphalaria pfeifferi]